MQFLKDGVQTVGYKLSQEEKAALLIFVDKMDGVLNTHPFTLSIKSACENYM